MELNLYGEISEKNGLELGIELMKDTEFALLDAPCIMVLITGAVLAERFCDGALLDFFKSGCIAKWLNRLKEIDSQICH